MMLRLGLRRARVRAEWINIWDDPAAAAEVRDLTGGDETFPAVVVGIQAMVNSSARQVIAAVRAGQPGVLPGQGIRRASRLAQAAGFLTRRKPRPGHAVDGPSRHTPV